MQIHEPNLHMRKKKNAMPGIKKMAACAVLYMHLDHALDRCGGVFPKQMMEGTPLLLCTVLQCTVLFCTILHCTYTHLDHALDHWGRVFYKQMTYETAA